MKENLLDIEDLKVRFYTYEGVVKALEGVNLNLRKGEMLGVAGETGCGKSVTGLSVLVLVPPPGKIEGGRITFKNANKTIDLLKQNESFLCDIRGKEISMIFQEPGAALNPVYTVETQLSEVFLHHRRKELIQRVLDGLEKDIKNGKGGLICGIEKGLYRRMLENPDSLYLRFVSKIPVVRRYRLRLKKEIRKEIIKVLREIEMADPERVLNMYPHELSGGMAQRVVIAMALACNPTLLIADEPTTSVDVTIQAQILDLIRRLKEKFGSSVIYITHDMGVIAETCDRVAIMYAGSICEVAGVMEIFKNPLHPYTKGLLESIPAPGKEFKSIKGTVPNLINPPKGCRFHPRCPKAMEICARVPPKMVEVKKEHFVVCHLYGGA